MSGLVEACLLYLERGMEGTEAVSLRSFVEDAGARLRQLVARLRAPGSRSFRFSKVDPAEISKEILETQARRSRNACCEPVSERCIDPSSTAG